MDSPPPSVHPGLPGKPRKQWTPSAPAASGAGVYRNLFPVHSSVSCCKSTKQEGH